MVSDLPADYAAKRERLLRLADRFASMDGNKKEKYADEKSRYSFGWSHGKVISLILFRCTTTDNVRHGV